MIPKKRGASIGIQITTVPTAANAFVKGLRSDRLFLPVT